MYPLASTHHPDRYAAKTTSLYTFPSNIQRGNTQRDGMQAMDHWQSITFTNTPLQPLWLFSSPDYQFTFSHLSGPTPLF